MNSKLIALTVICLSSNLLTASAVAADHSVASAIASGKAGLEFRYRFENVDEAAFGRDSNASTLRTRLNYTTGAWRGTTLLLELDDLSYVGSDTFNSTRNGKTTYPVVADPNGTGVNQFYLKYVFDEGQVTVGRQRLNLDNQRFVGGVGWRQNEQTYDGVEFNLSAFGPTARYNYVSRVSRVFGPDGGVPAPAFDSNSHLVNLQYKLPQSGQLTGYGYFLDFDNAGVSSSRTLGLRYTNAFEFENFKVPVAIEYAHQSDFGDNPANYSADYYVIEAGVTSLLVNMTVGNERLGADAGAGIGFATPLATLHKFQGWADKFLTTPAGGIDDRYIGISRMFGGNNLAMFIHDFRSDVGSVDYGSEIDLSLVRKVGDNVELLFKYARYNADNFSTDTAKLWFMVTLSFP